MNTKPKPIPDGFCTVTPYLTVRGAAAAIEFYQRAFGARELFRFSMPDGQGLGHAQIAIGNSIVMLADEFPQAGNKSPRTLGGTSVSLVIYSVDVDAAFKRAVDAGAKVVFPLENKFYGERAGCVSDPFGHVWTLMTHIEDVSLPEMAKRGKEFFATLMRQKNVC